ncbi:hypothetical protein NDA14_007382 [Ustilago hordei]|nr:hypothetical protein NDA14_007382 [Ustilago hordei]
MTLRSELFYCLLLLQLRLHAVVAALTGFDGPVGAHNEASHTSHHFRDPNEQPVQPSSSNPIRVIPDPSNSSHTGCNVPADPYPDSWSPLSATWDHEYSQNSHHKQAFLGLLVEVAERNWHRPWALSETDAAPYQHVQTGLTLGRKRTRESDPQNAHSSHIASENNSPTFQQGLEPDHDPAHAAKGVLYVPSRKVPFVTPPERIKESGLEPIVRMTAHQFKCTERTYKPREVYPLDGTHYYQFWELPVNADTPIKVTALHYGVGQLAASDVDEVELHLQRKQAAVDLRASEEVLERVTC